MVRHINLYDVSLLWYYYSRFGEEVYWAGFSWLLCFTSPQVIKRQFCCLFTDISEGTQYLHCSSHSEQNVQMSLHGPGDNFGKISSNTVRDNTKYFTVIQTEASSRTNDQYNLGHRRCKWTFTPLHESSVRVRQIWDHFPQTDHCIKSFIKIYAETADPTSPLSYPGYKSQCGVKNFPSEIISEEPLTFEFETTEPSEVDYQIDIVGTGAKECPLFSTNKTGCPDGPCCTGTTCKTCVMELGTDPLGKK